MITNAALIVLVILQLKSCMGFIPDATCNKGRKSRFQQHLTNANKKNLYSTSSSQNESTSSTRPKKNKGPKITPKRERPRIPVVQYHDDWVCVSKPAGMTVHRYANTPKRQFVVSTLLKRQLARKVFPVHRLDHRTSGALLFAFDSKTCGLLHSALRSAGDDDDDDDDDFVGNENTATEPTSSETKSEKTYIALVRGDWKWKYEEDEIVTVDKALKVKEEMKDARTELRLLSSYAGNEEEEYPKDACSLILCSPKTGRTHQIRRHLYSIGFPIIGDTQHGDTKINRWWRENRQLNRLFLHSFHLKLPALSTFDKERSDEIIDCIAPLPQDLLQVMERDDMKKVWDTAKEKDERLQLLPFDERGGTFGRNYKQSF